MDINTPYHRDSKRWQSLQHQGRLIGISNPNINAISRQRGQLSRDQDMHISTSPTIRGHHGDRRAAITGDGRGANPTANRPRVDNEARRTQDATPDRTFGLVPPASTPSVQHRAPPRSGAYPLAWVASCGRTPRRIFVAAGPLWTISCPRGSGVRPGGWTANVLQCLLRRPDRESLNQGIQYADT